MPFLELSRCNKAMCRETSVPQRAGLRTHVKSRLNLGTILHYKITESLPSVYVLKCSLTTQFRRQIHQEVIQEDPLATFKSFGRNFELGKKQSDNFFVDLSFLKFHQLTKSGYIACCAFQVLSAHQFLVLLLPF